MDKHHPISFHQGIHLTSNSGSNSNIFVAPPAGDDSQSETTQWANWGADNLFPKSILSALKKSSVAMRALNERANVHFGSGVIYGQMDQSSGEVGFKRLDIPEINDFLQYNNIAYTLKGLILNLETFSIAFPEFILSANKKKIAGLTFIKSPFCRYDKKYVYVSSDWPTPSKTQYKQIQITEGKAPSSGNSFCQVLTYPSCDDSIYYPTPIWHSVIENGWLDVAATVPKIKKQLFKNQAAIKYIIDIPKSYFEDNYSNWINLTKKEQDEIKQDLENQLTSYLTDVEHFGKSIIVYTPVDDLGKKLASIEIKAVESNFTKAEYLPEATAANAEILFAIGINPSIIGVGIPGTRASAGSGSYVREELWKMQALSHADRDVSLSVLRTISKFNDWDKTYNNGNPIIWKYGDITTLRTLDQNPDGKEESILGE